MWSFFMVVRVKLLETAFHCTNTVKKKTDILQKHAYGTVFRDGSNISVHVFSFLIELHD